MRFSALSPALNLPPLSKVRCCHPKEFGRLPEGLLHHPSHNYNKPLLRHHSSQRQQLTRIGKHKKNPHCLFWQWGFGLVYRFTLSIYPHRQQAQRFRVRDYPSSQAYIRRPKFRLFRRCRQASAYSCYRLPCRLRSACRCLYGR